VALPNDCSRRLTVAERVRTNRVSDVCRLSDVRWRLSDVCRWPAPLSRSPTELEWWLPATTKIVWRLSSVVWWLTFGLKTNRVSDVCPRHGLLDDRWATKQKCVLCVELAVWRLSRLVTNRLLDFSPCTAWSMDDVVARRQEVSAYSQDTHYRRWRQSMVDEQSVWRLSVYGLIDGWRSYSTAESTRVLENGASHINEYDWLLKYMTSGRLEVDLEKLNDWRRLHV